MSRRAWALRLALLLPLGAGGSSVAHGEDPKPEEKSFLTGLEDVRGALTRGFAEDAARRLGKLLVTHERCAWVWGKRAELEDLAQRLAFAQAHPAPKPKDLVRGELVSYQSALGAKTARLRIRYGTRSHDFESADDGQLLVFPARFAGPFTVEFEGSSWPAGLDDAPSVFFGFEQDAKTGRTRSYRVFAGSPLRNNRSAPCALLDLGGRESNVLDTGLTPDLRGAYKVEIRVHASSVTVKANNDLLGTFKKPEGVFGRMAILATGWHEVDLEGAVEPSWMQGLADAWLQEKRAKFLASFDVRAHLPAWVFEGPAVADAPPEEATSELEGLLRDAWPVPMPPRHALAAMLAMQGIFRGDPAEAQRAIEKLAADGAPEAICAWMSAQLDLDRDALPESLAHVERTLALAPGFAPALLHRGRVLVRLGRVPEAERALEALRSARPTHADTLESIAIELLLADRQDAAQRVVEDASRVGVRSEGLDALGRALVKVRRGPEWPRTFEYKTKNYHVVSDLDKATCERVGSVLEESLAVYKAQFKALEKPEPRVFKVYVFGGQAGFEAYLGESMLWGGGTQGQAAGVYSPLLKQLLVWNLPRREEMLQTVRHEALHQYVDQVLPDVPVWLNEGLAVYFENMERRLGVWKHGNVHTDHVATLKRAGIKPLGDLFDLSARRFYGKDVHGYSNSWLLVHLLREGEPHQKALLANLIERLRTEPVRAAVAAVFTPEVIRRLEQDLSAHLGKVTASR